MIFRFEMKAGKYIRASNHPANKTKKIVYRLFAFDVK